MRTALIGTHSTGKTTLLNNIGADNKIQEVARSIIETLDKLPHEMTREEKLNFQKLLWDKQIEEEDKHESFVSDRSLLDIAAYSLDVMASKEVNELIKTVKGRYDLLLYIPIDNIRFPRGMEKDGIRYEDEVYRVMIDKRINDILDNFLDIDTNCNIRLVGGHVDSQVEQYESFAEECNRKKNL